MLFRGVRWGGVGQRTSRNLCCMEEGLVSAREEICMAEFLNYITHAQMSVLKNSVQKMVGQEESFCFSLFYY